MKAGQQVPAFLSGLFMRETYMYLGHVQQLAKIRYNSSELEKGFRNPYNCIPQKLLLPKARHRTGKVKRPVDVILERMHIYGSQGTCQITDSSQIPLRFYLRGASRYRSVSHPRSMFLLHPFYPVEIKRRAQTERPFLSRGGFSRRIHSTRKKKKVDYSELDNIWSRRG